MARNYRFARTFHPHREVVEQLDSNEVAAPVELAQFIGYERPGAAELGMMRRWLYEADAWGERKIGLSASRVTVTPI